MPSLLSRWAVLEVAQPDWRPPMPKGPGRIPRAAGMFQPYLERAVSFLHASHQSFGIEGEVILPETAAQLRANYDASAVLMVRRRETPAEVGRPRRPSA